MSQDSSDIPTLFAHTKVIAIVGLSPDANRPSHGVAAYLQHAGYRIIPVNPARAGEKILGEHCYATLTLAAAALSERQIQIDMVDCFRKSESIESIADEAIAIGARSLWMQLGVVNEAAAKKARAAGLAVVMDRCTKIEHANILYSKAAKA